MVNVTGRYIASPATLTDGQQQDMRFDNTGALVTSGGMLTPTNLAATTSSVSRILSAAATTNATSAKASAGTIIQIAGYNAAAAFRYLKIYNKASAPTVGTDTPIATYALPPSTAFVFDFPLGLLLGTGIAYALTTGVPDGDTGALTAGDILALNVVYA